MKTIKTLAMTAATIVACAFTANIFAADNSAPATPLRGQFLQRIAERLNLTDSQKMQIKAALIGETNALQSLLGQLHDARKNLRDAIQANNANETDVRAAAAKVAAIEGDLAVERMRIYGKIAPVLTGAQRQQITEFQERVDDFVDGAIARIGERLGD